MCAEPFDYKIHYAVMVRDVRAQGFAFMQTFFVRLVS